MEKVFWCKKCFNMSTRPRIEFDKDGICNACKWSDEKKTLNWEKREQELISYLNEHKSKNGEYDCIVPVSGGKDGSYVAYNLKHKYGMNPLCITIEPPLNISLGDENLRNFVEAGYPHFLANPNKKTMQMIDKFGLIEQGRPLYGWLISIMTVVIRLAINYNISLIFYGEDGEVEYGGSTETKNQPFVTAEYMKNVYLSGQYNKIFDLGIPKNDLYAWTFPSNEELQKHDIKLFHWSYFENWDSYRNYVVAKEHCGLKENDESNSGTFTNFSQNDTSLYPLHTYLMYLKFGFGRASQDAGIEIRRGSMEREQAKPLVELYDNQFPETHIQDYLDYYGLTLNEFNNILDKFTNKDLFEKVDGKWMPKFHIE